MEDRSDLIEKRDAIGDDDDDSDFGAGDDLIEDDDGILKRMIRVDDSDEFRSSLGYERNRSIFPIRDHLKEGKVKYFSAPLVRWSKLPFRLLCRKWGCDVAFTSMIVAEDFNASHHARNVEFTTTSDDRPLIVQFAAKSAMSLATAAERVVGYCDAVDINCGCPQRWAIQEGIGCALLSQPEKIRDMVRMTRERTNLPVSIKIRVDPSEDKRKTVDLCRMAESVNVEWITIHGRTQRQKSTTPVDFDAVKLVRSALEVPVIINGDIFTKDDADRFMEYTGANGAMAARGILQNPALFQGHQYTPPDCISDFLDIATSYGANFRFIHKMLMYMLYNVHTKAEKRCFNDLRSIASILDYFESRQSAFDFDFLN